MPGWQGSDRRHRLPSNWPAIRKAVLERDGYRCKVPDAYGKRCTQSADDVDHIKNGDDHSMRNLRAICSHHHRPKSGAEGARAMHAKRREHSKKFRRTEQHPGLL